MKVRLPCADGAPDFIFLALIAQAKSFVALYIRLNAGLAHIARTQDTSV
jgi:hypothetical protein